MRLKRMWVHKHFFQSKIVLDILNKVEDVDKTNNKKKRGRFGRGGRGSLNRSIGRSIQLTKAL
jgi:hypothetical protein